MASDVENERAGLVGGAGDVEDTAHAEAANDSEAVGGAVDAAPAGGAEVAAPAEAVAPVEGVEVADITSLSAPGEWDEAASRTREEVAELLGSSVSWKMWVGIAIAVAAAFFISFFLGSYSMTPADVVQGVWTHIERAVQQMQGASLDPLSFEQQQVDNVLFKIRGPRVVVVMLVGAALAMAGASYQGMFKNPLTSPDLLGASAGASLGACLAMLLDFGGLSVQLFAFVGGILAVSLAVWLNRMVDYDPTLGLVLAGILVGTLFQSGTSLVKFMADANDRLPAITFWLMGSFSQVGVRELLLCLAPMAIGFVLLIVEAWKLNVLSFGEEEARAMGVNTRRTRLVVIFASTLVTSASVAVSGVVGWIGLVIPHLARALVGPNYKVLLPASMLAGATYLLLVDDIARLIATVEVPIGILTAILGVPFFVIIFRRNMKGWR